MNFATKKELESYEKQSEGNGNGNGNGYGNGYGNGNGNDEKEQGGGAPSKVMIAGKSYTLYVKVNGEFMTIAQAKKVLKAAASKKKK